MAKVQAAPPDKLNDIQNNLPTNRAFVEMANIMGLQDFAAVRGLPQAKSNQCLSDQKMIDREVQLTSDVSNQFPDFTGTPAFVINGKMLDDTASWDKLQPQLDAALK
jgi:protein-disulfide isomerase